MEMPKTKKNVCCICGKEFSEHGNNPEPVKPYEEGQCCDKCNMNVVIPERLRAIYGK